MLTIQEIDIWHHGINEFRKSDWSQIIEARKEGREVSMVLQTRQCGAKLNDKLGSYFRSKKPNYDGILDEYESEDVLDDINQYLKEY